MQFQNAITNLYELPSVNSPMSTQGLLGEHVDIIDTLEDWLKIRQRRDHYVSYVQANKLTPRQINNSHWVCVRATPVFSAADIKSPTVTIAQFGSELALAPCDYNDAFLCAPDRQAFVWREHTKPIGEFLQSDILTQAKSVFWNAPYLWGGKSPAGVDCSGLVQVCAFAMGIVLPRDSHQQEAALELDVAYGQQRANDLLFWPGHVAIAVDADRIFHATAHGLSTGIEKLSEIEKRAGKPSSIKRILV